MKISFINIYRILFAFVILSAIGVQFFTFKDSFGNFFSYFTILSNLLVSIAFLLSCLEIINKKHRDFLRGAATVYILITGIGFIFLLNGDNGNFIPWVSIMLHYISPLIAILDWIYSPSSKLAFKKTLVWLLFLACYLIYSLIRGAIIQWYPYPFLDPRGVGITTLFLYVIGLLILSFILLLIVQKLSGRKLAAFNA